MVSRRYFFEVCGAMCWKCTPSAEVTSTNFPAEAEICWEELLFCAALIKATARSPNATVLKKKRMRVQETSLEVGMG